MTKEEIISGLKFTVEMFLLDTSTGEKYTEPRNDMDKITIDACRGAIELLVQEPRWIPLSEGLPKDEQEILFSTKTGRVHSGKYHDDDSANQWYSHRDKCRAWNNVVNAWMPLPQPYKKGSRL